MDFKGERQQGGEITMSEKRNVNGSEVNVDISTEGDAKVVSSNANESVFRKRSLNRSVFSKPKSRFGEQLYPFDATTDALLQQQVGGNSPFRGSFNRASPNNRSTPSPRNVPVAPNTLLMASPAGGGGREEDDEYIFKEDPVESSKAKHKRIKTKALVECTVFFLILGCLVASLTVDQFEASRLRGLEMWKWCVLVMMLFSGMSVTNWVMHFIVFLIERKFLARKKVLYFVHGLKKSVQIFTWLAFVLLTWVLLFNQGAKRSKIANKILDCITLTLVSILIGSFLWFLKNLLLKILALRFRLSAFLDRIQESIFHHYVLQTLSGRPLVEEAERVGRDPSASQFSFRTMKKGKIGREKKVIYMGKIHKMKQETVSAWTMNMLVDMVRNTGLSILSNELEESVVDGEVEQPDKEITSEMEAMNAAHHIFLNIAQPDCEYFDEDNLQRFMIKEEVDLFFPLLEEAENGQIGIRSLTNWVVQVYHDRKALMYALTDTKAAVRQLNNLVTGMLIVITIITWLLLMEIATTKVLLLLFSQLVMAAFIFGNTCKTIFEGIIFVFVTHPFDVGDRCVIDGIQLMVEEMNISSTVFLTLDNELIYYPNSALATKPVTNYRRSPDVGDKVEFSIEFMTPLERIRAMEKRIKTYLEKNPQHWHLKHNLFVREIENLNKIRMGLYVIHKMNFQDYVEKNRRRTELVFRLKEIFDDLNIRYDLLPEEVHLCQSENKKQA